MKTLSFRTNLRCSACVEAIRHELDTLPGLIRWNADVNTSDKPLTLEGDDIPLSSVEAILQRHGYRLLGPAAPTVSASSEPPASSYYPLVLILAYLLAVCAAFELANGSFQLMRAMNHFMAGFFLVFSFFKLLNLSAFADAYAGYDLVASRVRWYGLVYPFLELLLGLAYLTQLWPVFTNVFTAILMGVSTIGVLRSLLSQQRIRCACLGTVFNLPMSVVTLLEDLLMVGMAVAMLVKLLTNTDH